MVKKLLKSEEEYYDYCIAHTVGYIYRKYGSQCCDYDSGMECDWYGTVFGDQTLRIEYQPVSYPCLMVWNTYGPDDYQSVMFVYPDDLK